MEGAYFPWVSARFTNHALLKRFSQNDSHIIFLHAILQLFARQLETPPGALLAFLLRGLSPWSYEYTFKEKGQLILFIV